MSATATETFVERWEAAVASADVAAVEALLAEDVAFRSPALFRPTVGRGPTTLVLAAVLQVFGELRYTHRYLDEPDGVTLQFETSVEGDDGRRLEVEGVDVFRLDPQGRITSLTVMLRPLNATQAVAARMREQLGPG
ncbi:MAG TPA: nuclear transport factor 2 family protein [Gaiella sp.]|nr:nuclear transport factor 2 family protein [Gaiella sp.]